MAVRVIHITAGTPRVGTWCPTCALPSMIEVDLLRLSLSGVTLFATVRRCANGPHPLSPAGQA